MSGSGTSVTVTATNADAGNTISATGTATDARANLSASCTGSVNVPAVHKCTVIEDWGECTFEKNPKKPWRVDNDCKDTLDKLSLRLQQMPNGKLDVVGYTNQEESVNVQTLGSQRSVNVKYYLTTDGPNKVDASRVRAMSRVRPLTSTSSPKAICAADKWKRVPWLTKPQCSRSRGTPLLLQRRARRLPRHPLETSN